MFIGAQPLNLEPGWCTSCVSSAIVRKRRGNYSLVQFISTQDLGEHYLHYSAGSCCYIEDAELFENVYKLYNRMKISPKNSGFTMTYIATVAYLRKC